MLLKKTLFKNKTFLITLAFLLVIALAAGIFGMEYYSAVSKRDEKINLQNSQISVLQSEKNTLNSKISQNESEISNQQKERDELNSRIKDLEDEVSRIKLTKAKKNSSIANKLPNFPSPNNGSKICYLTFDDGPSDNTLKILDILKQADNVKASFFVMGTSKLSYIKRAYEEGHTIALHTDTHQWSIYSSETDYFNDLNNISNKVKDLIGIETKIIRFPGGSSNKKSEDYNMGIMTRLADQVQQNGYYYFDWNVDSGDASGNNVPKNTILNNIISGCKDKGDICVLMHDTAAKNTTVEALPEIISYLRSQGYTFEALKTDSPIFHHGIRN